MGKLVLGIDLGGTNIRSGLINDRGELSHYELSSTQLILNSQPLPNLITYIRSYLERHLEGKMPDAISIGFPSTVSKDQRVLLNTPNIAGLNNVSVADLLEAAFPTEVFVNRDVNLLLYYDMYFLKLPLKGTIIAVYFGTGLGNAILVNGELLKGKTGVTAELGHIPVPGNQRLCGCGNIGCAETIVGGRYIEGLIDACFEGTPISELFTKHWPHQELEKYLGYMAIPVATEINILDPDHIILGGGILQMKDFPYDVLIKKIKEQSRKPYPEKTLEIHQAHQNQDNGVIGAGLYALRQLKVTKQFPSARVLESGT